MWNFLILPKINAFFLDFPEKIQKENKNTEKYKTNTAYYILITIE